MAEKVLVETEREAAEAMEVEAVTGMEEEAEKVANFVIVHACTGARHPAAPPPEPPHVHTSL